MEIDLYSKITDPLNAIDRIGEYLSRSGMFGCEKIEQGKVLALTCMTERLSPLEFRRKYHLIGGEVTQRSDSMLAEFRGRLNGTHRVIARTSEVAEIELTLGKETARFKVTFEELKAEPFVWGKDGKTLKKNWATPRARMQMLWARVVSDAVRAMAPEIVAGVVTPEEAGESIDVEAKEIKLATGTPAPAPEAPKQHKVMVAAGSAAPVIDVPVTPTVTETANVAEAKPEPATTLPGLELKRAVAGENGRLTGETVKSILSFIEGYEDNAMRAFMKWGWLKDTQDMSYLTIARANLIFNNPSGFVEKVKSL